jgi:diacylglycerol O-acyltransferase
VMDTLDALDTSFLRFTETSPHATLHLGAVAILDGPTPPADGMAQAVEGRLHLSPRLRQRLRDSPLRLGRPVWVDDTGFDLASHLHQAALPAPGGDAELQRLTAQVMAQPMDLTRPLWDMWLVDGLSDRRWSVIFKFHHVVADGLASVALVTSLVDPSPETPMVGSPPWSAAPPPTTPELLRQAIRDVVARQLGWLRSVGGTLSHRRQTLDQASTIARGLRSLAPRALPGGGGPLTGPVGPHRRVAWTAASLDDIDRIRSAFGGAANDIALAAVTGGYRQWLLSRSEPVEDRVIRAMVPVAVRPPGRARAETAGGQSANTVSTLLAELPVGLTDPVELLSATRSEITHCKRSRQASAVEALLATMDVTPPPLLSLSSRLFGRVSPHTGFPHTLVTTVPASRTPLHVLGRRVLTLYPSPPLTAPFRVTTAILTYDRTLTFGFIGDRNLVPDIHTIAHGTHATLAALLERTKQPSPRSHAKRPNETRPAPVVEPQHHHPDTQA